MNDFQIPDRHHIRAAQGWLELGNHLEANAELENITPELRAHPTVLELRWQIFAKESRWDACRDIALAITKAAPTSAEGWLHLAYATRRTIGGGLQAAWNVLRPIAERFPNEPTVPYNLACYACQLGNRKEAWNWLEKAFEIGNPDALKLMALGDPDLESFWAEISDI